MDFDTFRDVVWNYYEKNARLLPWRKPERDGTFSPYKILVSEIMLQQTQVARVIEKYNLFISDFPTIESLADAELKHILTIWRGLGYNRRAKYLHDAAKNLHKSTFPDSVETLSSINGIGENTAAAVLVYSFNRKLVFVETNIRTVFIHHFFPNDVKVADNVIKGLVNDSLPENNYREWYWALMDYGAHLKKQGIVAARQSSHYKKQTPFEGSVRKLRGQVLAELTAKAASIDVTELQTSIMDQRLEEVLKQLQKEELIVINNGAIYLP